jgi:UDP-2,4-diacetamido-2,4,6-trideoxy-beta-L-altropyranose hydrolase
MKIVILTEGGKNIGFGHVSRCVSLYEAFREKGITPELVINSDSSVKAILRGKRFRLHNWLKDENIPALLKDVDILVIDSYKASPEFYQKAAGLVRLGVYFDDFRRIDYPRGIVLNSSIHAFKIKYPKKNGIRYLLGSKYILLRKEFWNIEANEAREKLSTLTLTFGGNDIRNLNYRILEHLVRKFPGMSKQLILGADNDRFKKLKLIKDKHTILFSCIDARELKKILQNTDTAISAGGQTTNELARLGIPTISIAVADNQLGIVKGWANSGFLIYAGKWNERGLIKRIGNNLKRLEKDFPLRRKMGRIGRKLVDSKGAERVVERLLVGVRR